MCLSQENRFLHVVLNDVQTECHVSVMFPEDWSERY